MNSFFIKPAWIFKVLFLFVLYLYIGNNLYAQQYKVAKEIKKENYEGKTDSLLRLFGNKKQFIKQYELQSLIALSYYPELKDVHIVFIQKRIQTTMASRPPLKFLFQSNKKRTYNIYINNCNNLKGALFQEMSFNQQIGITGHEFGHIADYIKMSKWQLFLTGINYLFNREFKRNIESNVDKTTIAHGLGWQLYDFVNYINKSTVKAKYLKKKNKYYLNNRQILEIISNTPVYSEPPGQKYLIN